MNTVTSFRDWAESVNTGSINAITNKYLLIWNTNPFNLVKPPGNKFFSGSRRRGRGFAPHKVRKTPPNRPRLTRLCRPAPYQIGPGHVNPILFPLAAIEKGAEVIDGQDEGETKTYQGKYYQNLGVKVCLGYIADNPQREKQDIDRTDAVQDSQNKQHLGYMGFLSPKIQKLFHNKSPLSKVIRRP
jgi:hypothetical protein